MNKTLYSEANTFERTFQNNLFKEIKEAIEKTLFNMNDESTNVCLQDTIRSDQLSLNQNQDQNHDQLDQQIEPNIDEAWLAREKNQTSFLNDIDTIDLSTSSQKLREITEKEKRKRNVKSKSKKNTIYSNFQL